MQGFQSQVFDAPPDAAQPFELLLSPDDFKRLCGLFPRFLSLVGAAKAPRGASKRPANAPSSTELDLGHTEKRQAYRQALSKISNSNDYNAHCAELLALLRRHAKAGPFLQPVDPVAEGVPDYPAIIKEPMDLSTIQKKLANREYASFDDFDADVGRIFANALLYNKPGTLVNRMAEELKAYYERVSAEKSASGTHSHKKGGKAARAQDAERARQRQRAAPLAAQPLTFTEIEKLRDQIETMPSTYLKDVFKMVSEGLQLPNECADFDLDLTELPPKVARELQAFVSQKISHAMKKKKGRGEESTRATTRQEAEPAEQVAAVAQPVGVAASNPPPTQNYLEESSSSSLLDSISDDSI